MALHWRNLLVPILALLGYWWLLIHQLGAQWSVYDQYRYGWAVPFLCAYLFWHRLRGEGRTSNIEPRISNIESPTGSAGMLAGQGGLQSGRELTPTQAAVPNRRSCNSCVSWLPLTLLLGFAALLYVPTRFLHEANPIWRLTSWLWTLEVIALTLGGLYLAGGRRCLRRFAFPVAFFLVAVPWPSAAEQLLVRTLTGSNVATTIELLNAVGIPAIQHGNVIEITTGVVGVNEACSGIRSFQATLMISLFFGELYSLSAARRAFCVLLGFALSFGFNVGRTFLLTYVASKQGVAAIEKWHDPAGVTILVWCFVALWFASLLMKRDDKLGAKCEAQGAQGKVTTDHGLQAGENIQHPTSNIQLPPVEGRNTDHGRETGGNVEPPTSNLQPPTSRERMLRDSRLQTSDFRLRTLSFGLAAWFVLVEVGVQLWYRSHERTTKNKDNNWTLRLADLDSSFTKIQIPPSVLRQFNADESAELRWQDEGANWQLYYFRWLPARSLKKRVKVQLAKTHGPEKCLPAAGMKLQSHLGIRQVQVEGRTLALQRYVFEAQGRPVHVFYAIYEDPTGTEAPANRRRDFSSRLAAARAGSRNYGQRFLEVAVWGIADQQQAEAALQRQLEKLIRGLKPKV